MKKIVLLTILLLSVSVAYAQEFRIDDDNRVVAVALVKDQATTFSFYGDTYTLELGSFDFEHNRVTVEMHPELGTDILNRDVLTEWDLDIDGENDLGLTLTFLDPNKGSNAKGEVGTAEITLESRKPITLEETTVTTSLPTTIEAVAASGGEEVTEEGTGRFSTTTIAIIAGIVVGVAVILFLLKDKIKGMFGGGGSGSQQQAMPTNYKTSGKTGSSLKCSKCGKEVMPNVKFCNNCGAKVQEKKKFCPECGAEFKGGKFCQNCGHKMV